MPKKKKSQSSLAAQGGDQQSEGPESVPASPLPKQSRSQGSASPAPPSPSTPKGSKAKNPEPSTSALIICRNKHWRYISSFHGPWLQLPPEVLESLAFSNYASPRPQPIDPAVFFDLVKIRRLVDEATNLAVRAANGTASSALFSSLNATNGLMGGGGNALGLGLGGGGGGAKLSRERRHRMREHASQKLAQAYRLDEIAASVATMQSASALEDVGKLVLQRNEYDCEAKYVQFFHEKIPSRSLARCTSLEPLDDIITSRPQEGATYRTRAITRVLKEDFAGAVRDLTDGLGVCRLYATQHQDYKKETESASERRRGKQALPMGSKCNVKVDEKDQPTSLETQLLFHRGGVYLNIACQHIQEALEALVVLRKEQERSAALAGDDENPTLSPAGKQAYRNWLEIRKIVKTNARRALRDYMTFLSHFDYTAGIPPDIAEDLIRKVSMSHKSNKGRIIARERADHAHKAMQNLENRLGGDEGSEMPPIKVYQISSLFSAQPPSDLPPYPEEPSDALVPKNQNNPPKSPLSSLASCQEIVTYHPLLTDALHSLLLCHALAQTSEKEILRHAHMAARIARLCDGYPIFLAPRSPARADWMELLHHTSNWIKLQQSWETLCAPAPLPGQADAAKKEMTEALAGEQHTHGMILESLADDRVQDEVTFRSAVRAKEKRAEERISPGGNSPGGAGSAQGTPTFKRWAQEDGKEYPVCTERAEMIACWVQTAPVSTGISRTKGKKNSRTSEKQEQQEEESRPEASSSSSKDKTIEEGAESLAGDIQSLKVDAN